jgi:hypothetical protein
MTHSTCAPLLSSTTIFRVAASFDSFERTTVEVSASNDERSEGSRNSLAGEFVHVIACSQIVEEPRTSSVSACASRARIRQCCSSIAWLSLIPIERSAPRSARSSSSACFVERIVSSSTALQYYSCSLQVSSKD